MGVTKKKHADVSQGIDFGKTRLEIPLAVAIVIAMAGDRLGRGVCMCSIVTRGTT
jgi:hypothetical protein